MRCKFCGAELMDDTTVCTACGKDNAKDSLDVLRKKTKTMRTALLILLAVVLVAAVAAVVVISVWGGTDHEDPSASNSSSAPATVPTDGNPDDQTCKGSYTATDDQVIANHNTVVATLGDIKLTNGEFTIYYWNAVYDFLSQYGGYAAYFGLDITQPFDTQSCTMFEEPMTWQQAFVMQAMDSWKAYVTVAQDAKEANFALPSAYSEYLQNLKKTMETTAQENKFESVEAMLQADYGAGCTYEDYYSYLETYYLSGAYYEHLSENMEISDEDLQDYFTKNAEALKTQYGIEEMTVPLISVRHILIQPEGGTTTSSGTTYTDEQWENCRVKAQQIYDAWLAGEKSEMTFIDSAKLNSKDGNAQEGGIYENVYAGMMVKEFNDWCFDESRQYGDHGLVKTQFGYHIMFFVKSYEGTHPAIDSGARDARVNSYLDELSSSSTTNVEYQNILVVAGDLDRE